MPEETHKTSHRPRVALRCEATPAVGLGHAMRLLALARALPAAVLVAEGETLSRIRSLNPALPPLREIPAGLPPGEWIERVEMADIGDVVLDTLHSGNARRTAAEVARLKRSGRRVTVIDSMPPDHFMPLAPGHRAEGAPDLLVTPYVGASRLRPALDGVRWLHGPDYAILSPDFLSVRKAHAQPLLPKRILLTCGGSDPSGLSARVLSAFQGDCAIDVVVGPMFSETLRDRLEGIAATMPRATLHRATDGLLGLLELAGWVVGRPGLTRYEAACLGRQALYLVEGQAYSDYYRAFAAAGLAEVYFADVEGGVAAFMARLNGIGSASADVWAENAAARAHVDGQGAARVVRAIETLREVGQP